MKLVAFFFGSCEGLVAVCVAGDYRLSGATSQLSPGRCALFIEECVLVKLMNSAFAICFVEMLMYLCNPMHVKEHLGFKRSGKWVDRWGVPRQVMHQCLMCFQALFCFASANLQEDQQTATERHALSSMSFSSWYLSTYHVVYSKWKCRGNPPWNRQGPILYGNWTFTCSRIRTDSMPVQRNR